MRHRVSLVLLLAGCGRLAFDPTDEVSGGDAGPRGVPMGFSHVVARGAHTCAIYEAVAYCWGENGQGQLGDGTMQDRAAPTRVQLPAGTIQALTAGEYDSCAIVDEELYCWGRAYQPMPARVALPAPVTAVSLGKDFTCAIANETYCWGMNDVGQLGDGTNAPRSSPTRVQGALHRALYSGEDHTCALKVEGGAECWGHNDYGALGFGSYTPDAVLLPRAVDSSITTLPSIGGWSSCTVENNTVLCWGRLGDGSGARSATPGVVEGLPTATSVTCGGSPNKPDACCAIDLEGAIRCWGVGDFGRLGQGSTQSSAVPVSVRGLPGPAAYTAVGEDHACGLLENGELWCWGRGTSGQLGDGNQSSSLEPVRVSLPATR